MKKFLPIVFAATLTACGPIVGVSRSVSLDEFPETACVQAAVEDIRGVSSVSYRRLTGDELDRAQYPDEDLVQIHEYAYVFEGLRNSFQFAEMSDGDRRYRHLYRSDRTNAPLSDTDVLVDFMGEVEEALEAACGLDVHNSGATRVCVRVFGGCPVD